MYKFLLPLFALAFLLVSCGSQTPATPTPDQQSSTSSSVTPPVAVDTSAPLAAARASYDGKLLKGKHKVILHTTKGNVTLELDATAAPKTVTNFILLAKAGYYDNLTFHRVIPSFMIQGGDPNGNGSGGESVFGPRFEDEINANTYGLDKKKLKDVAAGQELPPDLVDLTIKQLYEKQGYKYTTSLKSLPFERGAIAMANAGPNTNGSQFFIVEAPKVEWLEGKHTVFGKVTAGMEVVDAIVNTERDGDDRPTTAITFTVEVVN